MVEFLMPAEGQPHIRTWMCWPCRPEAWRQGMADVKRAFADVARTIARFEPVVMAVNPADHIEAESFLAAGKGGPGFGITVWDVPLDDSWARDSGPTFVKDAAGKKAAIGWQFNAWGGKYTPFARDTAFARALAAHAGVPFHSASIICEGGAIHSDGQGTILTTEQCLLNPNRNPGLTRAVAEDVLHYALGARQVVWLGDGFSDAETDGHVDNIACFAGPGRVILGVPASKDHPDHEPVEKARTQLKAAGLEVIDLVQPQHIRRDERGRLLPVSYVNFYLCNGGLVMPGFDDPHDGLARDTLAGLFADRSVVTIPALPIVAGGGGIHCITQQEPR